MKEAGSRGAATEIRVVEHAPLPAMRDMGAAAERPAAMRWTRMLVWFMRTIGVVWIAKGLFAWTIILGVNHAVADFAELPPVMRGMIGFFAISESDGGGRPLARRAMGRRALADLRGDGNRWRRRWTSRPR